jgi:hypothetical protein
MHAKVSGWCELIRVRLRDRALQLSVRPEEMRVTETEWLAATAPEPMLWYMHGKAASRKFWLFTAASCVRASHFLPPELLRVASQFVERVAGAEIGAEERRSARAVTGRWKERFVAEWEFDAAAAIRDLERFLDNPGRMAFASARWSCRLASLTARRGWDGQASEARDPRPSEYHVLIQEYGQRLADALRCIFGNPFRPASCIDGALLTSRGSTVVQLARAAYDDHSLPEGTLDAARLVVLADALEDAGCSDAELLAHLRGPGPHVRGCWAVDLILAKS